MTLPYSVGLLPWYCTHCSLIYWLLYRGLIPHHQLHQLFRNLHQPHWFFLCLLFAEFLVRSPSSSILGFWGIGLQRLNTLVLRWPYSGWFSTFLGWSWNIFGYFTSWLRFDPCGQQTNWFCAGRTAIFGYWIFLQGVSSPLQSDWLCLTVNDFCATFHCGSSDLFHFGDQLRAATSTDFVRIDQLWPRQRHPRGAPSDVDEPTQGSPGIYTKGGFNPFPSGSWHNWCTSSKVTIPKIQFSSIASTERWWQTQ